MKAWRNGSVFDSISRGWGFKSLCLQSFYFKCILCEGINQLLNVFKKIERWRELNGIKVNKKKRGRMILKCNEDRIEIEGFPVIKEYTI